MEAGKTRRFRVVAALDSSDRADAVLEYALDQTLRHEHADLHIVTVSGQEGDEAAQAARDRLAALARSKLEAFSGPSLQSRRVRLHVRSGRAGEEIVELVHEVEADLLVIGGTTSGGRKPRLGAVADHVIHHVPCLVMLARVPDYVSHPLRDKQCPACVATRADTDGERWFCDEHTGRRSLTGTLLAPHVEPSLRGGLML